MSTHSSALDSVGRLRRFAVSCVAALALCLTSVPAFAGPPPGRGSATAPPSTGSPPSSTAGATAPPSSGNPLGGPGGELSGDEAGPNSCAKWPKGKKFTISLPREAELQQLVDWMMSISCQKFVINSKIRSGKVTILSPVKVTLAEAYAAFYAAIETMGLTVEPAGSYFKIVEAADAKTVPMYDSGKRAPNNDRFVTQLVRVQNANVSDVSTVLGRLKSKNGSIETVGNLMVITDRGSVVRRMLKITNELDQFGSGEKIFFYQLQYADAASVADLVREIFGESSGSASASKSKSKSKKDATSAALSRVIVDERTGTLIIVASDSDYATILRLIQQLDVRLPGGGGRIHVKKLKHSDPKEIAGVLQNLASGGSAGGGTGNAKNAKNKTASQGGASAELFSGEVKVTADEASRSLVVIASAADWANLEGVIDQLDAERKQVYVEMLLLETTVDRDISGGASAHFGAPITTPNGDGVALVGSAPSPQLSSLVLDPSGFQGLIGGVLGPQIVGSGQLLGLGNDIPAFGAVVQALQNIQDANIVAEPHVYTADNQEAELEVGNRVPTQGGTTVSGGAAGAIAQQQIVREDVTLKIKLTPHVNDEKTVSIDIELEDRGLVGAPDPVLGVTTSERKFKLTNIMARDDQPLVLGGLIREEEGETTNQIPGLGSIPILGWLFKRKIKTKVKRNLLIVLIPHVVDSPDDVRRIHERRTRERLEFIERETSLRARELETNIDFRTKSGMLSTIDREARRYEQFELQLREAERELAGESVTGEIGVSPRVTESETSSSGASGTKKTSTSGRGRK